MKTTDNASTKVPIWEPMFELAQMPDNQVEHTSRLASGGAGHVPENERPYDHSHDESAFEEAMMLGR